MPMRLTGGVPCRDLIRPVMPELDSLRGAAILLVLFFHGFDYSLARLSVLPRFWVAGTQGLGWLGVNLFFVLSGFLITGILLDSSPRPDYFKRFYIRRALRILPLYYLVLLVLYPLSRMGWLGPRVIGWRFVGLSFFYLSNVVGLFGVPMQYTVLWSLAVEEQFYILWPAAVRAFSRRGIVFATVAVILGCPVLRAIAYKLGFQYAAGYTWLIADELAFGALLAVLIRGRLAERKPMFWFSAACLVASAALLGFGAPFGIFRNSTLLGASLRLTGLNLLFTGTLAATLLTGTSRFAWIVRRPVLRFLGEISYGLYLIHMLVFDVVDHCAAHYFPSLSNLVPSNFSLMVFRFIVGSGLAVLVAFVSRRYFEEYFLRQKARWNTPLEPSGMHKTQPDVFSFLAAKAETAAENPS
jgi:peptidoglycan/LPS O-acetylase OafA/YrhL